ncbi:MAG: acyl-CoA thioesterase [Sneathiella sp.]|nr:acyl-CoA thioesterase [Sneathiella sp.]
MAHYSQQQKVLFQHCDPAGIVFYPRYFEMINGVVESWFEEGLNVSFADLHFKRDSAVPTVTINTTFKAPSRLGDVLELELTVKKIGGASLDLDVVASIADSRRFEATLTLVHVGRESGQPRPWPQDIRDKIENLLKEAL